MFERFTDKARTAVIAARAEAAERGEIYAPGYVDPYSSAGAPDLALPPAQTWLLREGWKKAGAISYRDVPSANR